MTSGINEIMYWCKNDLSATYRQCLLGNECRGGKHTMECPGSQSYCRLDMKNNREVQWFSGQRSNVTETMFRKEVTGFHMKKSLEMEENGIKKGSLEERRWRESHPKVKGVPKSTVSLMLWAAMHHFALLVLVSSLVRWKGNTEQFTGLHEF